MTIKRVDNSVRNAVKDSTITGAEAKKIIAAAEKNTSGKLDGVSNTEAKKIGDLYDNARTIGRPNPRVGWNPPPLATPSHPRMDQEARKAFNDFFIRNALPFGENESNIKQQIQFTVDQVERGDALPRAPRTATLKEIPLHDQRPVDGDRLDAFYDAKKDRFFLKSTFVSRMEGNEVTKWYGPFDTLPMHSVNPPNA